MASEATHQIKLEFNDSALVKSLASLDQKLQSLAKKLEPKIKVEVDSSKAESDLKNLKAQVASLKFDKIRGLEIDPASISKIKTDIVKAVDSAKVTPAQANSLFSALNSVQPKIKPQIDTSQARTQGLNFGELFSAGVLANLASSGIQAAISGIFDFLGNQFSGAKAFETTRVAFDGIIGDATKAGKVMSDVVDFAAKTPFEIPELANSAKMLAAFGTSAEDIIPQIKSVGDVSAGLNVPIEQMAYLVGTIQTQGKAMTADLNQFANRGVPIWKVLGEITGKTGSELRKMAESGEISSDLINQAFNKMSGEGGMFFNMMDRVSNTVDGRLSTLSDTLGGLGRQILGVSDTGEVLQGGLFDKVSQGVLNLTTLLGTLDFSFIGQGIGMAIDFVTQNFGLLASVIGGMVSGGLIVSLVSGFTALGTAITAAGGIMAFFGGLMATIFSPVVLIIGGLALAAGALYMAWSTNFMGIQEMVWGVFGAVGNFLATTMVEWLQGAGNFAIGFMNIFGQAFVWIQQNIGPIFGSLVNFILTGLGTLLSFTATGLGALVTNFGTTFQNILTFTAPFIGNVVEAFINLSGSVGDVVGGLMDALSGFFTADMGKIVQGGAKIFSGIIGVVASVAQGVLKNVESALNAGIKMINDVLKNPAVKEGLKALGISDAKIEDVKFNVDLKGMADEAMASVLKDTGQSEIADQIKSRSENNKKMAESARGMIAGFVQGVGSIDFGKAGQSIADMGKSAGDALKGAGGGIQGMLDGLAKNPLKIDQGAVQGVINGAVGSLQNMSKQAGGAIQKFASQKGFGGGGNPIAQIAKDMEKQAGNIGNAQGAGSGGGGGGGKGGGGGASDAQKELEKEAQDQKKAQEEINRLKLENIQDDKKRTEELAKFKADQDIANFKGTEDQKAEYAKLRQEQLQQELSKINKDFSEKQNKETQKQSKELEKQSQKYTDLQNRLEVLNQKQEEFTSKTKDSTRIANQNEINQVNAELAKIGTAGFGVSNISTVATGQPQAQPGQPLATQTAPMASQPPQPQADPSSLGQPIADTMGEAEAGVDSLSEKIKTGLAAAIEEGATAIADKLKGMDENTVGIFNIINENWISIAESIGSNVITGLINSISKGERAVYSTIANLSDSALSAVGIERRSREEFGDEGRGAANGVASVVSAVGELRRGFQGSFAGNTTNKSVNINQMINNNGSDGSANSQLINNML